MNKAVILAAYGTALYIILRKAYQEGHTGIPEPSLVAPPTYLYGILALSTEFAGNLAAFIAVALTFGLLWAYEDLGKGATAIGRAAGLMAPHVQPAHKRTAKKRNIAAGTKPIPKVRHK